MLLRHIYNEELSQASYLVGCQGTGEALVVDPSRDVQQYIRLAESQGLRITAVTETHIHADFVSGSRELAHVTGAALYLSDAGPDEWKYEFASEAGAVLLRDGDHFMVGNIRLEVLHTPGHTPEHISFLLTDTAGADRPMGIFTGDFVFVGDVGRPDLLERAAGYAGTMEAGARQLWASLQRFRELPDYLQLWPGHGAGSACGRSLGAVPQSTVGYERLFNWALAVEDEDEFVRQVLEGQPEPPVYFAEMKRVNRVGPIATDELAMPARGTPDELASALAGGVRVADTRPAGEYARGHVPGTISLPSRDSFLTWASWLLPYDQPFGLIVNEGEIQDLVARLRLIGLDDLATYWTPEVLAQWQETQGQLGTVTSLEASEVRRRWASGELTLVDVRNASEHADARIPGALHIPLGHLESRVDELPVDRPIAIHCQSGVRSRIATSLLSAHGRDAVYNLSGGIEAWQQAGGEVERVETDAVLAGAHGS